MNDIITKNPMLLADNIRLFVFHVGEDTVERFTQLWDYVWWLGVEASYGTAGCFKGIADASFDLIHPFYWRKEYQETKFVNFGQPIRNYAGVPSTKVTRCLLEEFGVEPIESLYRYEIHPTETAMEKAKRFQEEIDAPYAFLHFDGHARKTDKDLTEYEQMCVIEACLNRGLVPVVLDMHRESKLRAFDFIEFLDGTDPWLFDGGRIAQPDLIYELINGASLFVGIDSGPGHIAAATDTPGWIFWYGTFPVYCMEPSSNLIHCVPGWWEEDMIQDNKNEAVSYFKAHYNHRSYNYCREEAVEEIINGA